MHFRFAAALGIAALFTLSCGGVTDPSKNIQDVWNGTLPVGQAAIKTFSASNSGEISVIINSLSPVTSAALFVTFGQSASDGSCIQLNAGVGGINSVVISQAIVKGDYCIAAQDYFGTLTVPEDFKITISHP
jgi:hypothetical protein